MATIKNLLAYIKETSWFYRIKGSKVRIKTGSILKADATCSIRHSSIYVDDKSELHIGKHAQLTNVTLYIKGKCYIGDDTSLQNGVYTIDNGELKVGHHSKLSVKRVWIRFSGGVNIGNYTNINAGSEIRSDERVEIGDYCQISYHVNIWDTNTHAILSKEDRRKRTEQYFPYFGKELSRPKTAPVVVGSDCWIGQNVSLLKGTCLGNEVIVGYGCLLSGKKIEDRQTVVSDVSLKIYDRK